MLSVVCSVRTCREYRWYQERPYHDDNTASRLLSEVKHRRARLVLRWGTTLESRVLFFCSFLCLPRIQQPTDRHVLYLIPLAWLIPGRTQRIAIPTGSTISGLHSTTSTPTVTPYHQSMFFTIYHIRVKIRTTMSSEWYPRIHIYQKWRQKGQITHTPFIPHHLVMCSTRQCWVMINGLTIQQRHQPYLLHIPNYQMCHTYYGQTDIWHAVIDITYWDSYTLVCPSHIKLGA